MKWYLEFYAKYPMTTVRITSFFCGGIIAGMILVPAYELLGIDVYQHLYVPVLSLLVSTHFYFLRKAVVSHIKTSDTRMSWKNSFYQRYYSFLSVLSILFLFTAVGSVLGFEMSI